MFKIVDYEVRIVEEMKLRNRDNNYYGVPDFKIRFRVACCGLELDLVVRERVRKRRRKEEKT